MVAPSSLEELADAVRGMGRIYLVGLNGHAEWRMDPPIPEVLSTRGLTGIAEISPADQVVKVWAGTPLSALQAELVPYGQTIPYAPFEEGDDPSVGGALSLALPHRLEGVCGAWRDWILGMTIVRPDGSVAKCGSSAVKNVAGYDVGRLFIGARGALGVVAQVTLRTFPLKALPDPSCPALKPIEGPRWVQRVRLGDAVQPTDPSTGTFWLAGDGHPRYEGDWVLRSGCGPLNLPLAHAGLVARAKALFDPTAKLNPGALGE